MGTGHGRRCRGQQSPLWLCGLSCASSGPWVSRVRFPLVVMWQSHAQSTPAVHPVSNDVPMANWTRTWVSSLKSVPLQPGQAHGGGPYPSWHEPGWGVGKD